MSKRRADFGVFFFLKKSDCALVALLYNPVGFHEGGDLG